MTRVAPVGSSSAPVFLKVVYAIARRSMRRRFGRDFLPMPARLAGHSPRVLVGYGAMDDAIARLSSIDPTLRKLAQLRVASLAGCHW